MKKNLLPKMGMTALMAATAFAGVGTPVLAAAGTNYGATIEGTKIPGNGHTGKCTECNIYICGNRR